MTTKIINATPAPSLSGLVVEGNTAATGLNLTWDTPNDGTYFTTEIWASPTNNRATAVKYANVAGGHYLFTIAAGSTYYFWIRSVNIYSANNGAWYPASATGGISGTVAKIATADILDNAITDHFTYKSSTAISIPATVGGANGATVVLIDLTFIANGGRTSIYVEEDFTPILSTPAAPVASCQWLRRSRFYVSKLTVYQTGTATFTNGSTAVTGQGTNWTNAAHQFKIIGRDEATSVQAVANVISPTSLTLTAPWPGATSTAGSYYIQLTHVGIYDETTHSANTYITSGQTNVRFIYGNLYRREFELATTPGEFYEIQYSVYNEQIVGTDNPTAQASLRRLLRITEFLK